jgi:CubicO group peptidase (beta-lactamase class C family)
MTRRYEMFHGAEQVEHFRDISSVRPCRVVRRSDNPLPLAAGAAMALPRSYSFRRQARSTEDFLAETETVGLMVVKDGKVVHESYRLGQTKAMQWTSWSVVKSMVSALIGIALEEGALPGIDRDIVDFLPELKGSAFDGVSIKNVLQMSSGARWNESYGDPDSDIARFGQAMNGGSLASVAAATVREYPPGTHFRYNSIETHVLGMLLARVTGAALTDYFRSRLWEPCGMEDDAFFQIDGEGIEMSAGGLCATLRDYAKFGQLYLDEGARGGKQIVPAHWVRTSTRPNDAHVEPGCLMPQHPFGYGYQWWLPDGSGAFTAIGIYNQFVFVDPHSRVVIAKNSAYRDYAKTYDEAGYREIEHMRLFGEIVKALA